MRQLFDPMASTFVVLPLIKTTEPFRLGSYLFRSTGDVGDLSGEDAARLREVSEMFFLRDHLRISSCTYTSVPYVDLESGRARHTLVPLARLQSILAFFFSTPHEIHGDPLLRPEDFTMVILSPRLVSIHFLKPEASVVLVEDHYPEPNQFSEVAGYSGLYNFKHQFFACRGSRIYPPSPNLWVHQYQNIESIPNPVLDDRSLFGLLKEPDTEISQRVLTAIEWFNRAASADLAEEVALVHMATAFETLLGLPHAPNVTDRFRDSIHLILGRVERLDSWLEQFYNARSQIVHRGRAEELRFVSPGKAKRGSSESEIYMPLTAYGRQIFRLCVASLLFGARLARQAGLEEKFVTNQQRFERLCRLLKSKRSELEKLKDALELVDAIARYQFVFESGLSLDVMLASVRLAVNSLLHTEISLDPEVEDRLRKLLGAEKTHDHYYELDALKDCHDVRQLGRRSLEPNDPRLAVFTLVEAVWGYTFSHYFLLKEERMKVHGITG